MLYQHFLFTLWLIFIINVQNIGSSVVSANEVLGCGGYVKSEVEINYAQVSIKLFTQQGNLKYESECAPNNGYYFIPLYDKGDYILQVSPPSGWTFEPEKVTLKVDGETDPCSLTKDINFHFKGFAVVGRVISVGSNIGPAGVNVSLKQGTKQILSTVTTEGGSYLFTPLASGNYEVFASHSNWKLIKDKVSVVVTDQNGDAGSSLVVGGYILSGAITASGKLAEQIIFVLHGNGKFNHKLGCISGKPIGYSSQMKEPVICYVSVNSKGEFSLTSVTTGKYIIVPYFPSSNIKYEITPSELAVEITHMDLHIQDNFKFVGCSLRGTVVIDKNSTDITVAQLLLDGTLKTVTDEKGNFAFEKIKFGKHTLKVEAEGVEFDNYQTTLNLDHLEEITIVPGRYQTCFSVSVDSTTETNLPWTINVVGSPGRFQVQTDASGRGCLFLQPGEYAASVVLTVQDEEAGIRFGPKEHTFEVGSLPLKFMSFSQFLGDIHGNIECLESCRVLTVSLRPSRGSSIPPRTTTSTQGKFIFKEVVPGEYLMTVDKEEWCWKEQTITVAVNAKIVYAKFEQSGYRLTLNASHRTTLNYITNSGHTGTLEVTQGTSRECVSSPGKYAFTTTGCHKFGNSPLTWDTASPQLLSLIATYHQVTGTLVSHEEGPFFLNVKSETGVETVIGPLEIIPEDRKVYSFEHWITEGETATFTPSSPSNLFQYSPPSFTIVMEKECIFSAVKFEAERALFLKGYVKPALKGATITVIGADEPQVFITNGEGFFIAGPLDKSYSYMVTAEKLGYTISPASQKVDTSSQNSEIIKMTFEAYKLAEINVKILDEKENPLPGVLVSTSGGKEYRQNSLTDQDGVISFLSLMPSDYFLKPMMKEYTFEPSSKMVKVEGGVTVNVSIRGSRVAYSIFGQTISLSGEPEGDAFVEAIGVEEPCAGLQEEALADSHGNFRIRGLTPKCEYKIRLKKGEGINQHVDRSLPREITIRIEAEDHVGLKVVVIRPFLQMDVAIFVKTEPNYLTSLTAELYRDDMPDIPVHSLLVGQHPFFMLPPMIADQHSYTLQLVSSLSYSQYSYISPVASFKANSSFVRLDMSFKPIFKNVEAEISRGTVFALVFLMLSVAVGFNYNKIQPYVIRGAEMYTTSVKRDKSPSYNTSAKNPKNTEPAIVEDTSSYIEPISNLKKRVKLRKT